MFTIITENGQNNNDIHYSSLQSEDIAIYLLLTCESFIFLIIN
jgi:hypothetical protein